MDFHSYKMNEWSFIAHHLSAALPQIGDALNKEKK